MQVTKHVDDPKLASKPLDKNEQYEMDQLSEIVYHLQLDMHVPKSDDPNEWLYKRLMNLRVRKLVHQKWPLGFVKYGDQ